MKTLKTTFIILLLNAIYLSLSGQIDQAAFDVIVNDYLKENDGPGFSYIITKEGEPVYKGAKGMAEIELGVPLNADHIFRIGSITKQFTAAAILKLQEEGKLNVSDNFTKYLKDYPLGGRVVTIEQLLNHTSGIRSYTDMPAFRETLMRKDLSPSELIDVFKNEPFDFEPGEQYSYNNSGYILLGSIIESITSQSYEQYIEDNLFKALGMDNSFYGKHAEVIKNRVSGYDTDGGELVNAGYLSMTLPYAAGSLLSTVDDLAIWYDAVMTGKVLSQESLTVAHSPSKLNSGKEIDYGYGWSFNDVQGSPTIGHGGGINGFSTESLYFPNEKIFVAVFANCNCLNPGILAMKLSAQAIGKPLVKKEAVAVDDAWTKKYIGIYEIFPGLMLNVREENGRFLVTPTGQSEAEITPVGEHKFFVEVIQSDLEFVPESDGSIESLILYQGGAHKAPKLHTQSYGEEVKQFVGKYELEIGEKVDVVFEDGVLIAKGFNEVHQLEGINENTFLVRSEVVKLEFTKGEAGDVDGLVLYMGQPMKGRLVE